MGEVEGGRPWLRPMNCLKIWKVVEEKMGNVHWVAVERHCFPTSEEDQALGQSSATVQLYCGLHDVLYQSPTNPPDRHFLA